MDQSGIPISVYSVAISACLLFVPNRTYWALGMFLILITAGVTHQIEAIGFLWIVLLVISLYYYRTSSKNALVFLTFCLTLGIMLGLHDLPGFNNVQYINDARLSTTSATFDLWFNYDKALFGVLVVGIILRQELNRSLSDWRQMLERAWPILLLGLAFTFGVGLLLGYSQFELNVLGPSFGSLFWPWVFKNLFFTVIAEEAMFRGLIQRELSKYFAPLFAVFIAAVLFGMAHIAGGWQYVLLSSVAGFVYGYAYLRTGRIEAAILAHLLLNVIHFSLFSYPYAITV